MQGMRFGEEVKGVLGADGVGVGVAMVVVVATVGRGKI